MTTGPEPLPWGIYVHVPWCRRRCPYCAFYVEVDRSAPWPIFVDAVVRERDRRASEFDRLGEPTSLFLGGGTPSRMPTGELARAIHALAAPGAEISVEANPEDIDEHWLDAVLGAGVTRLSLGLQTFDPRFAHLLNRACTVERAAEIARMVGRAGLRSWSLDVIFGVPGQTVDDLRADLDRLLATDPPHVSLYGLTIEPGTPFERARDKGVIDAADADTWREMYDLLVSTLRAAGIDRYEVSNFARPGHASIHNRLYWSDRPYLGLGPSAHGYAPDGQRWRNVASVDRYLVLDDPTEEAELPVGRDRAIDLIVSALRAVEGVDLDHLAACTGHELTARTVAALTRAGLIVARPRSIALTDEGFPVADGVASRLISALRPTQAR